MADDTNPSCADKYGNDESRVNETHDGKVGIPLGGLLSESEFTSYTDCKGMNGDVTCDTSRNVVLLLVGRKISKTSDDESRRPLPLDGRSTDR